jgi:hypothetical protein
LILLWLGVTASHDRQSHVDQLSRDLLGWLLLRI